MYLLLPELQAVIGEFADLGPATLRDDWREGSSILKHLKADRWWNDYAKHRPISFDEDISVTWYEWCLEKMIIGPPRPRGNREITGYDEDYMSDEDFHRHFIPWSKTWPKPEDCSWCRCRVRKVPDWAKIEYNSK
tara:strand:+ start:495 stop:899 length:405 start_codon:yes stop_codon:yes gene_type:complete